MREMERSRRKKGRLREKDRERMREKIVEERYKTICMRVRVRACVSV